MLLVLNFKSFQHPFSKALFRPIIDNIYNTFVNFFSLSLILCVANMRSEIYQKGTTHIFKKYVFPEK